MKVYEYIIRIRDRASDKISRFDRNIRNSRHGVNRFRTSLRSANSSAVTLGGSLAYLSRFIGPAVIGAALTFGATKASALAREFEQTTISFETLIGKAKQGRDLLNEINEMANVTPFTGRDLQNSGKLLLGYGVTAQKIMPTLRMLGDISGGNAQKLHLLSLAYAQSQAAGRLMGQDLLQMVNAGFNPLQVISEKTGKSIGVLKKEMENGAISAKMVEAAFKSATMEGGRFFNMTIRQSKTFEGRLSTLRDKIEIWARGTGKSINTFLAPTLEWGIRKMDELISKRGLLVADSSAQTGNFRKLHTEIRPLIDEYLKLRDSAKEGTKEFERLKDIQGKIAQAIPSAVSKWDKHGNVLRLNAVDAHVYIDEQEKLFKLMNDKAQGALLNEIKEIRDKKAGIDAFIKLERAGKIKSGDSHEFAKTGLAELSKLTEQELQLRNQLAQLRNDRVLGFLKKDEEKTEEFDFNKGLTLDDDGTSGRITGGGKRAVNVTINLDNLVGVQHFDVKNLKDTVKDLEAEMIEMLLRVVNSGNQAASQ